MYNLRFFLNDNNIFKCDYKKISNSNQIDLMLYNEIKLSKRDLLKIHNYLLEHDLNHKYKEHKDYVLHEYIVPSRIIRDMITRMEKYQEELEKKKEALKMKQLHDKKRNRYELKRKNKFKKKVVTVSVLTLLALSTLIYGKQLANNKDLNNNYRQDNIIEMDALEAININDITNVSNKNEKTNNIEIPNISGMIEDINTNLNENNFDYTLEITADDWTNTQKYIDCYNNYYPIIEKYAEIYGIDPKVALAIACHERGEHSNEIDDGGAIGLFQIQVGEWDGNDIRAFNFNTQEWETYTIELDNIRNIEENVKAGMMIFQDCLIRDNYNVEMSVQEYNFGHGGLLNSLSAASESLGVDINELEKNGNTSWFDYRTSNVTSDGYQMGDPNYVENVFKYINDGDELIFKTPDNENIIIKYKNLSNTEKLSI